VVDYLIRQVIEAFMREENGILSAEFSDDLISRCEGSAANIVRSAKRLAGERVFVNPRKLQIEIGSYSIVDVLLKAFCEAYIEFKESRPSLKAKHVFALLGVNAPGEHEELYPALIRIMDFVSGSTDKFAAQLSQRLSGISF
jgi:dGTPase